MLMLRLHTDAAPEAGDHGEPRLKMMLRLHDDAAPEAGDHREPGAMMLDARLHAGPYTAACALGRQGPSATHYLICSMLLTELISL